MELKFTGLVEFLYPIKMSGENKDYPRQMIKVKGVGEYHKNYGLFSLHGENVKTYNLTEGEVVDIYYRMNTGVYNDSGNPHGSNNILRVVKVEEVFDPYDHF